MTRKLLLTSALGGLLVAGGGAAAGVWMFRDGVAGRIDTDAKDAVADADVDASKVVRQDQPLYYDLTPPFTVNVKDSGAVLQVGVSVGTHYADTVEAAKSDDPALRSAILMVLADATEDTAMNDDGKGHMLSRIVAAANRQLVADGYGGRIDSAYFTQFVATGGDEGV